MPCGRTLGRVNCRDGKENDMSAGISVRRLARSWGVDRAVAFLRLKPDVVTTAGSQETLRSAQGMSVDGIVQAAVKLV